jgi:hypothetical protein
MVDLGSSHKSLNFHQFYAKNHSGVCSPWFRLTK